MDFKKLYALSKIATVETEARKQFGDNFAGHVHEIADSAENGAVLAHSLTAIDPKILTKKYAQMAFLNAGIPVDNTGGVANTIESLRIASVGSFAVGGVSANNAGIISIEGEGNTIQAFPASAKSSWTNVEARQASEAGYSYLDRLMQSGTYAYQQLIDDAQATGIGSNLGIMNYTGYASQAATGVFTGLTAVQMYDDVAGIINAQFNGVSNTPELMATHCVMPTSVYNLLQSELLSADNASNITVLEKLKASFPMINFFASAKATNDMVVFAATGDSLLMRVPMPLEISPVFQSGFEYMTQYQARVAGVDFLEDAGGRRLTGVA